MQVVTMDAVDEVKAGMERGDAAPSALGAVAGRLERVRRLGGRYALVGVSPEVSGMLKAVGRTTLVC